MSTLCTQTKVWYVCVLEIALVCLVSVLCYLMVCSEVVNLPLEHLCPEVFTDELHYVQLILEAGRVSGQPGQNMHLNINEDKRHTGTCMCVCAHPPLNESLSHPEAHAFEDRDADSSVLERGRNTSGLVSSFICHRQVNTGSTIWGKVSDKKKPVSSAVQLFNIIYNYIHPKVQCDICGKWGNNFNWTECVWIVTAHVFVKLLHRVCIRCCIFSKIKCKQEVKQMVVSDELSASVGTWR